MFDIAEPIPSFLEREKLLDTGGLLRSELFRFADKPTRRPADVEKPDVDRLHEHGWDDAAIIDTVLVVSLYVCANRFCAGARPRRGFLSLAAVTKFLRAMNQCVTFR